MKIAISSQGKDLNSQIDPRFGRAQYFIVVDPETLEFSAIENPNISASGGAGIQSGQIMAERGVKAVLTGHVGPNAFQTLSSAGIQIITGVFGTVKEAIEKYKSGQYKPTESPTTNAHTGMNVGNPGFGMGRGRGMRGNQPFMPQQQISKDQELQMLKEQADSLQQQLDMLNIRIKELENK